MNSFKVLLLRTAFLFTIAAIGISSASEKAQAGDLIETLRTNNALIKSMPIMERPNRIGHVYGNSVRWVYYQTNGRVNIEQIRPKVLIGDL